VNVTALLSIELLDEFRAQSFGKFDPVGASRRCQKPVRKQTITVSTARELVPYPGVQP
jgi:hypothetical protein